MRFSIIIPTYGRPERLGQSLAAIADLDYPRDQFEVIVVDDGSPEPAEPVARLFSERLNLTVLRQANAGPATARNAGVRQSRGEILAFLDDDCVPKPDWLRQMDAAARQSPEALLAGATTNGCTGNVFAATNQVLTDAVCSWMREHESPLRFYPSNNLAVSAAEFRAVGGFDSTIPLAAGEDRELCARWIASGRRLAEVPSARIDHYHPQTLRSFLSMHFRYGRGAAGLHERQKSTPFRFVSKGLYWHLLKASSRISADLARFTATLLLVLTQAAAAAGYFAEALRPVTVLPLVWLSYALVALGMQWQAGFLSAELSGGDELSHFMNGVLVRDYLAQGFPAPPLAYAREYYLHYPKIAIGHWPPLFAAALGLWLLLTEPKPATALWLIAAILAALAAFVYRQTRLAGVSWVIAWLTGLLLLTLPLGRLALGEVMIEPWCALLMIWCAILYARYLDSGSLRDSVWFGAGAALALLAKPNAAPLALLPPLCLVLGRRWRLLRTAGFWLPLGIVLLVAGPWYVWSWRWLVGEWVPGQTESFAHRVVWVSLQTLRSGLDPLPLTMIVLGMAGWFAMRKRIASHALVFGSLAAAVLLIHTVVSPHHEGRHYLLALPAVLVGLGWFLGRMPVATVGLILAALFALQGNPLPPRKLDAGMTPVAKYVLDHRASLGGVYLVSSDASGEGAFISAIALGERRPSSYVLRGSKMLAEQTWAGRNYRLRFESSEKLAETLERWPVGAVVVDQALWANTPDRELLSKALTGHPQNWEIALNGNSIKVWVRRPPWNPPDLSDFRRELADRLSAAWR